MTMHGTAFKQDAVLAVARPLVGPRERVDDPAERTPEGR